MTSLLPTSLTQMTGILCCDEAAKYTFALHSARIGRIQSMKATGGSASQLKLMNLSSEHGTHPRFTHAAGVHQPSPQDEETMNKVSGHTRTSGRLAYDVSQLVDEIAIMTGANSVEVLPMDTIHTFHRECARAAPAPPTRHAPRARAAPVCSLRARHLRGSHRRRRRRRCVWRTSASRALSRLSQLLISINRPHTHAHSTISTSLHPRPLK